MLVPNLHSDGDGWFSKFYDARSLSTFSSGIDLFKNHTLEIFIDLMHL